MRAHEAVPSCARPKRRRCVWSDGHRAGRIAPPYSAPLPDASRWRSPSAGERGTRGAWPARRRAHGAARPRVCDRRRQQLPPGGHATCSAAEAQEAGGRAVARGARDVLVCRTAWGIVGAHPRVAASWPCGAARRSALVLSRLRQHCAHHSPGEAASRCGHFSAGLRKRAQSWTRPSCRACFVTHRHEVAFLFGSRCRGRRPRNQDRALCQAR